MRVAMRPGAKILLGLALVIAGALLATTSLALSAALVVFGALLAWLYLAKALLVKPWSSIKMKVMQALLGLGAMAIALTPLRMPPRGILTLALLGAAIGWFVPFLLSRKK